MSKHISIFLFATAREHALINDDQHSMVMAARLDKHSLSTEGASLKKRQQIKICLLMQYCWMPKRISQHRLHSKQFASGRMRKRKNKTEIAEIPPPPQP